MEYRKSTTGFIISINATTIFWRTKGQKIIALSLQRPNASQYLLVQKNFPGFERCSGKFVINRTGINAPSFMQPLLNCIKLL